MATKAELEREVKAYRAKFEKIGAAAIEFAEDHGYCEEVEEFLDQWDIPYPNAEPIDFVITLRVTAKPTGREPVTADKIEQSIPYYAFNSILDSDFEDVNVEVDSVSID